MFLNLVNLCSSTDGFKIHEALTVTGAHCSSSHKLYRRLDLECYQNKILLRKFIFVTFNFDSLSLFIELCLVALAMDYGQF